MIPRVRKNGTGSSHIGDDVITGVEDQAVSIPDPTAAHRPLPNCGNLLTLIRAWLKDRTLSKIVRFGGSIPYDIAIIIDDERTGIRCRIYGASGK